MPGSWNVSDGRAAKMSVVLVTPNQYGAIRETMEQLQAQTAVDQLEIVIVAPSARALDCDRTDWSSFDRVRVVEVGEIKSTGKALAAGVRESSAPVVSFAEEHAYPDPAWAEALIQAHRNPWAAISGTISNANPGNIVNWASFFTDFGPWAEPAAAGEIRQLAWHHAAYKRGILLEYGSELDTLLETESLLHAELQARGYRFYLEPAAKTKHVSISRLSSFIISQFNSARLFAANRARSQKWSPFRRLFSICRLPFVSLVRLGRIVREIFRPGRKRELLPRILPFLILGAVADALGQLAGSALGPGHAAQSMIKFELTRCRYAE